VLLGIYLDRMADPNLRVFMGLLDTKLLMSKDELVGQDIKI
jgi:hypothetical protein